MNSSSSSSLSPKPSPPNSPRGLKRLDKDRESPQDKAKRPKLESTQQHGPDLDAMWREMPLTVVQQIAWVLAPPTHLSCANQDETRQLQAAHDIRAQLLALALANRQTFRCLRPLLAMARWSVELALLASQRTTQVRAELLLGNPMLPNPDDPQSFGLEYLPPEHLDRSPRQLHGRRLDALLQCAIEHGQVGFYAPARTQMAEALLTRLFEAWCERLERDVSASNRPLDLPHLPLDDLPLRLFRSVSGNGNDALDPTFLIRAIGFDGKITHSPTSMPAKLLLQHLKRMDEDLKLFIWLHLDLLLESEDADKQALVSQTLHEHGIANDGVIDTVRRWRTGFLSARQIDQALAEEVWQGLQRMPLLGAAVPLALLLRFCTPALRALVRDEELIDLIHRAMAEMVEMIPSVTEGRFAYLFCFVPPELGLPAFKRLPPHHRAMAVERGFEAEEALEPYQDAVAEPTAPPQ